MNVEKGSSEVADMRRRTYAYKSEDPAFLITTNGPVAKWYRVVLLIREDKTEVVGSSPIRIVLFAFLRLFSSIHLSQLRLRIL